MFIVYLIANIGLFGWRDWRRALLVAVVAALATMALALAWPPSWGNAAVAVATCVELA